jgi:hypothetical protein
MLHNELIASRSRILLSSNGSSDLDETSICVGGILREVSNQPRSNAHDGLNVRRFPFFSIGMRQARSQD